MNKNSNTDVIMLTYNRPHYTALSLPALLERSDASTRVWLWHNGEDEETLEVVHRYRKDLHRFYHSRENLRLREPTNWFYENADGAYLGKVDDDCLVPKGWTETLRRAHQDVAQLGVLGCWRFHDEDFNPALACKKIRSLNGGHRILENLWVEGSGYLMKRDCVGQQGLIQPGTSFTHYCIELARKGWLNGWYFPFLYQEHMDDPRSEHTAIRCDADLRAHVPLSAERTGAMTVSDWTDQIKESAQVVQSASADPRHWSPLRRKLRSLSARISSLWAG